MPLSRPLRFTFSRVSSRHDWPRCCANELPQMTADVLSVLPASKAADVLTLLPEDYQLEVVHHVLCSGPVADDVLRDLADSLVDVISRQTRYAVQRPARS